MFTVYDNVVIQILAKTVDIEPVFLLEHSPIGQWPDPVSFSKPFRQMTWHNQWAQEIATPGWPQNYDTQLIILVTYWFRFNYASLVFSIHYLATNKASTGHQPIVQNWHFHLGHNLHGCPLWQFSLPQTYPMWWQTYICQHAENTTSGQPKCTHDLQSPWGGRHLVLTMQDELHSTCYGHHFIIPHNPGPYSDIPAGTTAVHQAEHKAQHKNEKKAHDTALTIQMLLQNFLINAIPDDYLAELWDPDQGYNQSTFCNIRQQNPLWPTHGCQQTPCCLHQKTRTMPIICCWCQNPYQHQNNGSHWGQMMHSSNGRDFILPKEHELLEKRLDPRIQWTSRNASHDN